MDLVRKLTYICIQELVRIVITLAYFAPTCLVVLLVLYQSNYVKALDGDLANGNLIHDAWRMMKLMQFMMVHTYGGQTIITGWIGVSVGENIYNWNKIQIL